MIDQKLSNLEILCFVLGYQGGTLHQIAKELECDTQLILDADYYAMQHLCRVAQSKHYERVVVPLLWQAEAVKQDYKCAYRVDEVQRVAKAIWEKTSIIGEFHKLDKGYVRIFIDIAKAAIAAMNKVDVWEIAIKMAKDEADSFWKHDPPISAEGALQLLATKLQAKRERIEEKP